MWRPLTIVPWLAPTLLLVLVVQHHHFVYSSAHDNNHLCSKTQQLDLFQFKQSLSTAESYYFDCDGLNPKTNGWEMSGDCCTWDGVTCDPSTGDVIGLDLSCSKLEGVLHSNSSLFHLTHLQRLNLAFNFFYGSMPPRALSRFATSLTHLNLSSCFFSGLVPSEIWNLSKLVSLDLSGYYGLGLEHDRNTEFPFLLQNLTQLRELSLASVLIDSVLPKNLSSLSSLTFLDLSFTGLRGKLPREIFFLPQLQTLRLSGNVGVDEILPPSNWSGSYHISSSNLRKLDVSYNTILCQLSDIIGSLQSLKSLVLRYCNMSGAIPVSILNHTELRELDLSWNNLELQIPHGFADLIPWTSFILEGNYGKTKQYFPSWIANLTQLVHLDLQESSLIGPLPSSNITRLQKLKFLDLSDNSLSGEIPSWVFDLPLLEDLQLERNDFKGELHEFRFTNSLRSIRLSVNELTGSLPQSILRQPNLQELDLTKNKFKGIVEMEKFSSLKKLESLSLSYNQFAVRMINTVNNTFPNLKIFGLSSLKIKEFPYFLRTTHKLEYLDLSHNQIHGLLPDWICNSSRIENLYLSGNNFSGVLPHCLGNLGVTSLDLSMNNFSGVLPHCLGNLGVTSLDLSMNNFRGTIPSTFTNLSNLSYLNLHGNQMEGTVPNLGNCTYLQVLDLGSNKLKDTFPHWLKNLPELTFVTLGTNEFYGSILIPNIYRGKNPFPKLQVMDLSNNGFKGEIPNMLINLTTLQDLDLHNNDFQGSIPSLCAKDNQLASLNLRDNRLQGAIPSSLKNCVNLEILDIGKNQIEDTFPRWLGTLPELHVLVMSFNRFHGPINTNSITKTPFPKLRIIDLSCNNFSGTLPELFFKNFQAMEYVDENNKEITYMRDKWSVYAFYYSSVKLVMKGVSIEINHILTTFTTIDLSNNQFEGKIPEVLGNLKFLRQLNLSHNNLVGRIPSRLGNISMLEVLDLNSNQLHGEIPPELANLNFLGKLNVSYNELIGHIPSGKQFNTFLIDSYYGNVALCGFPLDNCVKRERSQPQVLQDKNESGLMDGFTWEVVLMGYGCGIVLGFIIGCIMFWVGKPKWFTGIVRREVQMKARRTRRSGYRRYGRRNWLPSCYQLYCIILFCF